MIHHGDCLDVMPTLDAESIDAIAADPPYGIGFMGHEWDQPGAFGPVSRDHGKSSNISFGGPPHAAMEAGRYDLSLTANRRYQGWCEAWGREMLRVAKPGAHALVFGGTRTYHRLAAGLEDAGWELRDCLVWAYASGFPKSHNLGGDRKGWGTALKPAWEPIVLARKPLVGTVAANVALHGTGALNIDATRIGFVSDADRDESTTKNRHGDFDSRPINHGIYSPDNRTGAEKGNYDPPGRWPANVILTDAIFDGETPDVVGGGMSSPGAAWEDREKIPGHGPAILSGQTQRGRIPIEAVSYSRFFLVPKAGREDREPILRGQLVAKQPPGWSSGEQSPGTFQSQPTPARENVHPTVKPLELMRHLVRLVTPPDGLVLDPFLGSGTTALAAEMEGFRWVGIEREAEYVAIAEARLRGTQRGLGLPA